MQLIVYFLSKCLRNCDLFTFSMASSLMSNEFLRVECKNLLQYFLTFLKIVNRRKILKKTFGTLLAPSNALWPTGIILSNRSLLRVDRQLA